MDLWVVVSTLNGRDQLGECLDALAEHAPGAEVVVANGPSADGTTGMVRDRDDVDVLLELAERNVNVARNAGIEAATGEAVAFLNYDRVIVDGWRDALESGLDGAGAVVGPTHRTLRAGVTADEREVERIAGDEVTVFRGDNVAIERSALADIDGFDERLERGGARDAAHRLARLGHGVEWQPGMGVRCEYRTDGGATTEEWGEEYRSRAYRFLKNYGLRPGVLGELLGGATRDAIDAARSVLAGDETPSWWLANGDDVIRGLAGGTKAGMVARARDRSPRRNPFGLSSRDDRTVRRYDWR